MPRKKFVPSDEQRKLVQTLYGYGLTVEQIRPLIINPESNEPICRDTLFKVFGDDLEAGRAKANAKLLQTAYGIAFDAKHKGCVPMNIFIQKTRLGFKETNVRELTGKDGEELPAGPQLVVVAGKRVDEIEPEGDGE